MSRQTFDTRVPDMVQAVLKNNGATYIRRYTEPRTKGYRTKWWGINNISLDVEERIKMLPGIKRVVNIPGNSWSPQSFAVFWE